MKFVARLMIGLLGVLLRLPSARALVIVGDGGLTNTNAPAGDQGWSYVGTIHGTNGANTTGVYLDNNWVITASHVYGDTPTNFMLNGSSYDIQLNTWTQMTNADSTKADLAMVRLGSAPPLATNLTLCATSPTNGTAVTMIGNGSGYNTNLIQWYVDTNSWSWFTTNFSGAVNFSGYAWNYTAAKRWGTNTVAGTDLVSTISPLCTSYSLYTTFDNAVNEAQGALYDSGGGVFSQNGDTWELAGIMFTIGTYSNQWGGTAVFGNATYAVDVSCYRDQIIATSWSPIANFTAAPTNGFAPLQVTFTDKSSDGGTNITNRHWDFGDGGNTNITSTNLTYTYAVSNSSYTAMATLTVSNALGSSSTNQLISVWQVPPPTFLGGSSAFSVNPDAGSATISFMGTNGVKYRIVYKDDLLESTWKTDLNSGAWMPVSVGNEATNLTDITILGTTQRFYRIEAESVDAPP